MNDSSSSDMTLKMNNLQSFTNRVILMKMMIVKIWQMMKTARGLENGITEFQRETSKCSMINQTFHIKVISNFVLLMLLRCNSLNNYLNLYGNKLTFMVNKNMAPTGFQSLFPKLYHGLD